MPTSYRTSPRPSIIYADNLNAAMEDFFTGNSSSISPERSDSAVSRASLGIRPMPNLPDPMLRGTTSGRRIRPSQIHDSNLANCQYAEVIAQIGKSYEKTLNSDGWMISRAISTVDFTTTSRGFQFFIIF